MVNLRIARKFENFSFVFVGLFVFLSNVLDCLLSLNIKFSHIFIVRYLWFYAENKWVLKKSPTLTEKIRLGAKTCVNAVATFREICRKKAAKRNVVDLPNST